MTKPNGSRGALSALGGSDSLPLGARRAGFRAKEIYPKDFDALQNIGHAIAGSPQTVRRYIEDLQAETGVNYVLCQMMFGDMTFTEAETSLALFAREVIPAFKAN